MKTADRFHEDIRGRIDYFRREFHPTYSEAVGVLEMAKHELLAEALETDDSDDDDGIRQP